MIKRLRRFKEGPSNLNRFVQAQSWIYEWALAELKCGRKKSHWMWYIFPQIDGLGASPAAQSYAIKSAAEAKVYLNHRDLGPRLIECCKALLRLQGLSASEILGFPDDRKLRSSMTLFASVSGPNSVFAQVLGRFFGGKPDQRTLELLQRGLPR